MALSFVQMILRQVKIVAFLPTHTNICWHNEQNLHQPLRHDIRSRTKDGEEAGSNLPFALEEM